MKKEKWSDDSHKILEQATGLTNYNRWLIGHFTRYLGRAILEIGSGQGGLSKLLPAKAIVILSDVIPAYLEELKQTFTDPVIKLDIEKEVPSKLLEKMDTVFSSNVFEHIKDDQKAFENCYRLLEPGGHLLLFVPARPKYMDNWMKKWDTIVDIPKQNCGPKRKKLDLRLTKSITQIYPGIFYGGVGEGSAHPSRIVFLPKYLIG